MSEIFKENQSIIREVYETITEYMNYYNNRRRHGSIKYMVPNKFYEAIMRKNVKAKAFAA
jgi:putative transposase